MSAKDDWVREKLWKNVYTRSAKLERARQLGIDYPSVSESQLLKREICLARRTLGVASVDAGPEAAAFVTDICSMLGAIARHCGSRLSAFAPMSESPAGSFSAEIIGEIAVRILDELGVHRGQLVSIVPPRRIITVRVEVTLLEDGPFPARCGVLRTYHYVTRSATKHDTGERQDLALVLSGAAH